MMKDTLEQEVKRPYEQICSGAEALSSEVEQAREPKGFDEYITKLNKLRREYIGGFQEMDSSQRADAYYLLDILQSQIHGTLDVFRATYLRGALRRKTNTD